MAVVKVKRKLLLFIYRPQFPFRLTRERPINCQGELRGEQIEIVLYSMDTFLSSNCTANERQSLDSMLANFKAATAVNK